MRKILVCGSIAFDNVMDFPGHFQDQIVPDKLHTINISFLVNTLKKVRGGTAPNISYNLALLGEFDSQRQADVTEADDGESDVRKGMH